jgi:hypothetical protein
MPNGKLVASQRRQCCHAAYSISWRSRDSSVGIGTRYGLAGWLAEVLFPLGEKDFSLLHSVQTGSGTYLMGAGGKAAGE